MTIDEILDQIILLEKIEKGIEQANNGQILTEEEVDQRMSKWLK